MKESRRELGDTLLELTTALLGAVSAAPGLRARSVELAIPVEVCTRRRDGVAVLLGDVPRSRLRGDFDIVPGRCTVTWQDEELP